MSTSRQKLQLISNYPQLMNREELLQMKSASTKNDKINITRGFSMTQSRIKNNPNSSSQQNQQKILKPNNSLADMRSTHQSQFNNNKNNTSHGGGIQDKDHPIISLNQDNQSFHQNNNNNNINNNNNNNDQQRTRNNTLTTPHSSTSLIPTSSNNISKSNNNINLKIMNQNKNVPIKIFTAVQSPSSQQSHQQQLLSTSQQQIQGQSSSKKQNQFFFPSQRNTPKNSQDKREYYQNMKSKSTTSSQNLLSKQQSDISQFMAIPPNKNDGFLYPFSNDISTPKWNPNQFNSQINSVTQSDSFYISKTNFEIIKNQNIKLQQNYEFIKDQIMQALLLLEEEFVRNGNNNKEVEYKKSKEIIQQLVNLLSESAKNELKLSLSNTQQLCKQEQIAQLKTKIESMSMLIHHIQQENKTLISLKQDQEKEILKKNRELLQNQKIMKADKRKISQLEKRLELILETNFVEYAQERASLSLETNNNNNNNSVNIENNKKINSNQYQSTNNNNNPSSSISTQNLRVLLSDLVKDNEQLKKDTLGLEIDILRYSENEQKLNKKIATLNQKIESMKKKISAKDLEQLHLEEKAIQSHQNQELIQQQSSSNQLKNLIIPSDSDFRINSLKFEYSQILMELIEHGSNNFSLHVSRNKNADKRTKLISLMANQFISYRDFSNRFVQTVRALHEFQQIDDLIVIQQKVSLLFPNLFKSETAHLWIQDSITGIMYTYNSDHKKANCISGKGIFQDVIRGRLPVNMKNSISNRYLYISMNDESEDNFSIQLIQNSNNQPLPQQQQQQSQQLLQSQNNNSNGNNINLSSNSFTPYTSLTAFCLPIIIDNDVIGVLEISDNQKQEGFSQDEELFGVVCANFLSSMIKKIKLHRQQIIQIKYTDLINSCFKSCLDSENLYNLEKKIHQQVKEIFGVDICRFYYVKEAKQIKQSQHYRQIQQPDENQSNFSSFYSLVNSSAFSYKKGIIGEAISTMKPIICNSASNSSNFDPFVDVKTLLPIYTTPLFVRLEKDNTVSCVGVLQIPLKKRTQIAKNKDSLLLGATPLLGIDHSLENQIKHYSDLIAHAIQFINDKNKKNN